MYPPIRVAPTSSRTISVTTASSSRNCGGSTGATGVIEKGGHQPPGIRRQSLIINIEESSETPLRDHHLHSVTSNNSFFWGTGSTTTNSNQIHVASFVNNSTDYHPATFPSPWQQPLISTSYRQPAPSPFQRDLLQQPGPFRHSLVSASPVYSAPSFQNSVSSAPPFQSAPPNIHSRYTTGNSTSIPASRSHYTTAAASPSGVYPSSFTVSSFQPRTSRSLERFSRSGPVRTPSLSAPRQSSSFAASESSRILLSGGNPSIQTVDHTRGSLPNRVHCSSVPPPPHSTPLVRKNTGDSTRTQNSEPRNLEAYRRSPLVASQSGVGTSDCGEGPEDRTNRHEAPIQIPAVIAKSANDGSAEADDFARQVEREVDKMKLSSSSNQQQQTTLGQFSPRRSVTSVGTGTGGSAYYFAGGNSGRYSVDGASCEYTPRGVRELREIFERKGSQQGSNSAFWNPSHFSDGQRQSTKLLSSVVTALDEDKSAQQSNNEVCKDETPPHRKLKRNLTLEQRIIAHFGDDHGVGENREAMETAGAKDVVVGINETAASISEETTTNDINGDGLPARDNLCESVKSRDETSPGENNGNMEMRSEGEIFVSEKDELRESVNLTVDYAITEVVKCLPIEVPGFGEGSRGNSSEDEEAKFGNENLEEKSNGDTGTDIDRNDGAKVDGDTKVSKNWEVETKVDMIEGGGVDTTNEEEITEVATIDVHERMDVVDERMDVVITDIETGRSCQQNTSMERLSSIASLHNRLAEIVEEVGVSDEGALTERVEKVETSSKTLFLPEEETDGDATTHRSAAILEEEDTLIVSDHIDSRIWDECEEFRNDDEMAVIAMNTPFLSPRVGTDITDFLTPAHEELPIAPASLSVPDDELAIKSSPPSLGEAQIFKGSSETTVADLETVALPPEPKGTNAVAVCETAPEAVPFSSETQDGNLQMQNHVKIGDIMQVDETLLLNSESPGVDSVNGRVCDDEGRTLVLDNGNEIGEANDDMDRTLVLDNGNEIDSPNGETTNKAESSYLMTNKVSEVIDGHVAWSGIDDESKSSDRRSSAGDKHGDLEFCGKIIEAVKGKSEIPGFSMFGGIVCMDSADSTYYVTRTGGTIGIYSPLGGGVSWESARHQLPLPLRENLLETSAGPDSSLFVHGGDTDVSQVADPASAFNTDETAQVSSSLTENISSPDLASPELGLNHDVGSSPETTPEDAPQSSSNESSTNSIVAAVIDPSRGGTADIKMDRRVARCTSEYIRIPKITMASSTEQDLSSRSSVAAPPIRRLKTCGEFLRDRVISDSERGETGRSSVEKIPPLVQRYSLTLDRVLKEQNTNKKSRLGENTEFIQLTCSRRSEDEVGKLTSSAGTASPVETPAPLENLQEVLPTSSSSSTIEPPNTPLLAESQTVKSPLTGSQSSVTGSLMETAGLVAGPQAETSPLSVPQSHSPEERSLSPDLSITALSNVITETDASPLKETNNTSDTVTLVESLQPIRTDYMAEDIRIERGDTDDKIENCVQLCSVNSITSTERIERSVAVSSPNEKSPTDLNGLLLSVPLETCTKLHSSGFWGALINDDPKTEESTPQRRLSTSSFRATGRSTTEEALALPEENEANVVQSPPDGDDVNSKNFSFSGNQSLESNEDTLPAEFANFDVVPQLKRFNIRTPTRISNAKLLEAQSHLCARCGRPIKEVDTLTSKFLKMIGSPLWLFQPTSQPGGSPVVQQTLPSSTTTTTTHQRAASVETESESTDPLVTAGNTVGIPSSYDASQAVYCEYFGLLFCEDCHQGNQRPLPAFIVTAWDFSPRPVSNAAAHILDLTSRKCCLEAKDFHPAVKKLVPEIQSVITLRRNMSGLFAFSRCAVSSRNRLYSMKLTLSDSFWTGANDNSNWYKMTSPMEPGEHTCDYIQDEVCMKLKVAGDPTQSNLWHWFVFPDRFTIDDLFFIDNLHHSPSRMVVGESLKSLASRAFQDMSVYLNPTICTTAVMSETARFHWTPSQPHGETARLDAFKQQNNPTTTTVELKQTTVPSTVGSSTENSKTATLLPFMLYNRHASENVIAERQVYDSIVELLQIWRNHYPNCRVCRAGLKKFCSLLINPQKFPFPC